MTTARFIVADVFEGLASLPDDSVDLVLSSPPFLALRSYLPAGHPTKAKEIGSEATPADFIDALLDVVEACDRVLAPHGSLVFELGDTYAGSGGAGGDYGDGGVRDGQPKFDGSGRRTRPADVAAGILAPTKRPGPEGRDKIPGWPMAKSLSGMPSLFAWSLAYGRNLLRPERSTEPWRIRNVVAWCRPNPPVGALGDKVRPATSYLTIATKARDRYFDIDAVRTPSDYDRPNLRGKGSRPGGTPDGQKPNGSDHTVNAAGAPPLDHWWFDDVFEQDAWLIPTQPYKGSHYATWPPALLTRPILAMCPEKVCTTRGEPSRRIAVTTNAVGHAVQRSAHRESPDGAGDGRIGLPRTASITTERETLGWTDCGHDAYRRGTVLDPFAGSGTTLQVATGHGRDAIGIDLDARNADLARERVGMWLSVEHLAAGAVA